MKAQFYYLFLTLFLSVSCSQSSDGKGSNNSPIPVPETVISNQIIKEDEVVDTLELSHFLDLNLTTKSLNASGMTASSEVAGLTTFYLNNLAVASLQKDSFGLSLNLYFPKDSKVELAISGTLTGSLSINNNEVMKLLLSTVNINSPDGPALNIQSHRKTFLVLEGSNVLKDSSTYSTRYLPDGSEMDLKATLFSEGALAFSGAGNLTITAKKKHALTSDEHIIMRESNISLTANKKDAIRANMAFILQSGTLNITTLAGAGKGIKVDGKEDDLYPNCYVKINGGNLTINSHDKGLVASWETAEDAKTIKPSDDPNPYVIINGGNISVTTFGTPVESTGDDKLTPEGIESKGNLTINGGNISISSTDDALNGIKGIYINGGRLYATSTYNDALDSNGIFSITGGLAVFNGSEFPESGIDSSGEVFINTGGVFVATGGRNSTPDSTVSTQNAVLFNNQAAHLIMIKDLNGDLVFAYNNAIQATSIFISSPALVDATQYNVFYGGVVDTFETNFHGLYLENLSSSSGTFVRTFETTGRLSNLH